MDYQPPEIYAKRPMESPEDAALRIADGKLLSDIPDDALYLLKRRFNRDLKRARTSEQIQFFEEHIQRIRSELRGRMVANALDASAKREVSDAEIVAGPA